MANIRLKVKSIPVTIDTEYIRLDALLKLAGAAATGGQAKFEIQSGEVELDGEVCLLRGKKVYAGQRIRHAGKTYEVVSNVAPAAHVPAAPNSVQKKKERGVRQCAPEKMARQSLHAGEKPIPSESNAPQAKTPFSKNIPGKQSGRPGGGRGKS